jgi:hypothetical protein
MKTYTINNTKYTQSPLVIGQVSRLLSELQGVTFASLAVMSLVAAFGEKLPRLLACVLIPEGQTPAQVKIDALSEQLFDAPIDTTLEVLADFLEMAALESISERIRQIVSKVTAKIEQSGQDPSAPNLPEATP